MLAELSVGVGTADQLAHGRSHVRSLGRRERRDHGVTLGLAPHLQRETAGPVGEDVDLGDQPAKDLCDGRDRLGFQDAAGTGFRRETSREDNATLFQ